MGSNFAPNVYAPLFLRNLPTDLPPPPVNLSVELPSPPCGLLHETSSALLGGEGIGTISLLNCPATQEPAGLYGHMVPPLPSMCMPVSCETSLTDKCCVQNSTVAGIARQFQHPAGRVLMLSEMIGSRTELAAERAEAEPALLASAGSMLHGTGNCKPCGFFHKNGCKAGVGCSFCHLCDSGEKKRRQREKREMFRAAERLGMRCDVSSGN